MGKIKVDNKIQHYYAREPGEIASALETDPEKGLSNEEAEKRLSEYGPNELEKRKQKSLWRILLEQFKNPIVWLLIGAGILAFIFGEIPEAVAIIIVIVINTLIGFIMERQAMRSMKALRKMGGAKSKVIREGKKEVIDSVALVPGDLVYLESGDMVTADARLVRQKNFAIKEAALTGESTQVSKHIDKLPEGTVLADRKNSVFKGTLVTRGSGFAVVVGTGSDTELGKISDIAHGAKKESTPLEKRLNSLSKKLIWLTLAITVLILVAGVARGRDWFIMVETAIALAVAAIPEGLPVIATITLARGMVRLARKKAIVKSLEAVQTLGETNVIFTDKTGTLTENEMYLDTVILDDEIINISEEAKNKTKTENTRLSLLLKTGALCNDSSYRSNGKGSSGDPIEIALLRSAEELLGETTEIRKKHKRVAEIPFSSEIKMMGTVNEWDGSYMVCVKGATEALLDKCIKILKKGNEEVDMHEKDKWLETEDDLAAKGLRTLGFAYRRVSGKPDEEDFIHDLVLLALGGFLDPAREEVKEAIEACREAGIKVVMVTGDHPETAGNIAEKVGLVEDAKESVKIHGKDLGKDMGKQKDDILSINIFARIDPAQKLDIIELFQNNNYIVAMTGDGVNDAPALKKADIGIAMGLRGTEAAKEVADIVLKDDAFSSIVLAIKQGRIIFGNIRTFIVYLLSCNLSEILVVGTASFLGLPAPLLPLQILFLNMVTDVFPALALGMNEGEDKIMKEPPRKPGEPIVSKTNWISIITYGGGMTIAVIGVELISLHSLNLDEVRINNMTFYTLILVQLWNVFNLPDATVSFFKNEVTRNKYVWYAILISIVIVAIAWFIPPVRETLSLVRLEWLHWVIIFSMSFVPIILIQFMMRVIKIIK